MRYGVRHWRWPALAETVKVPCRRPPLRLVMASVAFALAALAGAAAAEPGAAGGQAGRTTPVIRIGYLSQAVERPPGLSTLEVPPEDEGLQGARLAIADNNTTGRFTGQTFALVERVLPVDGDVAAASSSLADDGVGYVVSTLNGAGLDRLLAVAGAGRALVFNAGAPDDRFRRGDCRAGLLHTLPSRAMLADALAQYLIRKNWKRWFLVTGPEEGDALYAAAVRRAAGRFGGRIVAEKTWSEALDIRRTAEAEIPVFTQVADYDILIVADEIGFFGEYLPYRTWQPRPVAGTQGLTPVAWDRNLEQWGARQLQSRFQRQAGRPMTAVDYAAWAAVRSIGEATARTSSADSATVAAYLSGDAFALAGFKGLTLSYRPWDGQLRQPIALVTARAVVSMSPQEGFLHPLTTLDTLGDDRAESECKR
ncbi:MAG: ABC transporter substrate-binding protein [Rhodospirillales bacterium]|nr:ABC transporter substrate-binding protein [Rhodospirillales bacterium]